MPMLTEAEVRAAKPKVKPYKIPDERGMHLLVTPAGGKLWRFRYRIAGVEKLLALGAYPDVPLKRARERREEARRLVAEGVDPNAQRRAEKASEVHTFESIAREWLALQEKRLSARTIDREKGQLERFIFPELGSRPIGRIAAHEVLAMLRRIEARGIHDTAHRTRSTCSRIFRFAIATARAEHDVTADLRGALAPVAKHHLAAITEPAKIAELLRAIDDYAGQATTHIALRLAPLVFVRPGELRASEWTEFSLDGTEPEWRIPGERMKMGEPHIVPLSTQAMALIRELQPITGHGRFLFPALTSPLRPMSENTINGALRRLGYSSDEMTGHGFRSMASTCLNEQGWHPDLIELQLAHAERNKVRAAYNRAARLAERRKMMQAWSNYLDGLRAGANVVSIGALRKVSSA
jgi:integrase